jgi:hypothetical protein
MTAEEWADSPEVPKKKRGLPGWLWFCGGGCLIAVVLAVVGGFFMVGRFKQALDQDAQWEKLAATIEMDDRPSGWMIVGMDFVPMIPFDGFVFTDNSGRTFNLMILPPKEAGEMEEVFSGDFQGGSFLGLQSMEEVTQGTIDIQGKEFPVVRFTQTVVVQGKQSGALIDITPEDSSDFWLLQAVVPGDQGAVTDEYITKFLAPFHIGPAHVPYVDMLDASTLIEGPDEPPAPPSEQTDEQ